MQPNQNEEKKTITPNIVTDFSMHTMQEDLANLKNKQMTPATQTLQTKQPQEKPSTPISKSPFENTFAEDKQSLKLETEQPVTIKQTKKEASGNLIYKLIFSSIVFILLAVLGFGYFYFQKNNQPIEPITPIAVEENTLPVENQPQQPKPINEQYSTEKPNLFVFNPTENSAIEIKNALQKINTELTANESRSQLYEFIPVDNSNNHISFEVFAKSANLPLSPNTLEKLTSVFSIFFFKDNNNEIRLALKINSNKNTQELSKAMLQEEKNLTSNLSFLFLDLLPESNLESFKNSATLFNNKFTPRYLPLNKENTLSLDYLVTENSLILATSKETLKQAYLKTTPSEIPPTPSTNNLQ